MLFEHAFSHALVRFYFRKTIAEECKEWINDIGWIVFVSGEWQYKFLYFEAKALTLSKVKTVLKQNRITNILTNNQ